MAKRDYKVGDKIVMNGNFPPRSKYYEYAGMKGRIAYANRGRSHSYDIKLDGTGTRLEYVDAKMFCSADELATPEQKRETLRKNLLSRRADAEKVIGEKKAFVDQLNSKIAYIGLNPDVTEIDETAYTAWLIASTLQTYLQNRKHAEDAGARTQTATEATQDFQRIVMNILKTNNK